MSTYQVLTSSVISTLNISGLGITSMTVIIRNSTYKVIPSCRSRRDEHSRVDNSILVKSRLIKLWLLTTEISV